MSKVYVIQCPDYDHVPEAMQSLLAMMGGIEKFVKSGEHIVLKPNLLAAVKPEKATTTHPSLVAARGEPVRCDQLCGHSREPSRK